MKTKYFIYSIFTLLTFVLLTGCYTSFGSVRHQDVYEEEIEYYADDDYANVNVYHYYYSRPSYRHFVYYDPYDYWYDEPTVYISFGYYNRPYYWYSHRYGCVYPVWHPVVYRPHYVPAWYYNPRYVKPVYAYQKRDFHKRGEIGGRGTIRRNGGHISGNNDFSGADNANKTNERRTISRRGNTLPDRTNSSGVISRNGEIARRTSDRSSEPKRTIQTRPAEERKDTRIERSKTVIKRAQSDRSNGRTVTQINTRSSGDKQNVERNPGSTTRSYQSAEKDNNNQTTQISRPVVQNTRSNDNSKSESRRTSSYSRPTVRETQKSTPAQQSRRSESSRSSYSESKSPSNSSSGSGSRRRF